MRFHCTLNGFICFFKNIKAYNFGCYIIHVHVLQKSREFAVWMINFCGLEMIRVIKAIMHCMVIHWTFGAFSTVEPRYNEVLGTMNITLLYHVSHYIKVKKQRNMKSWDQQNYLVIRGFCYIRPLYNEVPLYNFFS